MKTLMLSAAVLLMTSPATADLIGTTMDLHLEQSGLVGQMAGPTSGVHTYGTTTIIELAPGVSWDASSPAALPGHDNSILLDFTNFQYASYITLGPSTSTLDITNIAEDVAVGSAGVYLLSDPATSIAQFADEVGNTIHIGWDVGAVIGDNPVNPRVIVAWDSVPAPGALGLFSLAGVLAGRRRRTL
jgi:MYXO-CTERM domain-containing protein